jgi:hypothetical protein
MREEFKQGVGWMGEFYWTMRITDDPEDPFVVGEQPLFISGDDSSLTNAIQQPTTHTRHSRYWNGSA